jgi:hypothetical protein
MFMRNVIQFLVAGSMVCLPAIYARSNTETQFNNPNISRDWDTDTNIMTTGVLEKGVKPHEYTLKSDDGHIYNLTSEYVNLHKRVGEKVVVTGTVMKHMTRMEQRQQGRPLTHLQVTDIRPSAS